MNACMHAQSCPILYDSKGCSPPDSSVHGILQARILEWAAISSSRESSQPRDQTQVSCISCTGRQILSPEPPRKPMISKTNSKCSTSANHSPVARWYAVTYVKESSFTSIRNGVLGIALVLKYPIYIIFKNTLHGKV